MDKCQKLRHKCLLLLIFVLIFAPKTQMCPNGTVSNGHNSFRIEVIRECDTEEKLLQYHVTADGLLSSSYVVTIDTCMCNSQYHNISDMQMCKRVVMSESFHKVVIPKNKFDGLRLFSNCPISYDVCIEANSDKEIRLGLEHNVSKCFENVCQCERLQVNPEILTEDNATLLVFRWNLNAFDRNSPFETSFYLNNCNNTNNVTAIAPIFQDNNHAILQIDDSNDEFCVIIIFRNDCGCSMSKTFVVNRNILDELEVQHGHEFKKEDDINLKLYEILQDDEENVTIQSRNKILDQINKTKIEEYESSDLKMYSLPNILLVFILVLVIIALIWRYASRLKALEMGHFIKSEDIESIGQHAKNSIEGPENAKLLDRNVDSDEFPRSYITIIKKIGKGAFGEVFLGKALINGFPRFVAVKTLREKATVEEMEDFLAEILILKKIGEHGNIVKMLKCCTISQPYMMVMEYVPSGDLKHYLLDLRSHWDKKRTHSVDSCFSECYIEPETPDNEDSSDPMDATSEIGSSIKSATIQFQNPSYMSETPTRNNDVEKALDHTELQNFALQIAKGMAHLEKISITHRDLAARNILINEKKVLKISDFGLSRTGPYINKNFKRLPLRWMALEAIEHHFYNNKSDVWSYGVVLWEIGTLGGFPYEPILDNMLIYHIKNGLRLQRPEICTDELYGLMLRCWMNDPALRPSFEELVALLDVNKKSVYLDFNLLNPSYVFPPVCTEETKRELENNTSLPRYVD